MRRAAAILALAVTAGSTRAAADLESVLASEAPGLHAEALHAALASWRALSTRGTASRPVLSVIDYALPSTAKRLWVFDLDDCSVLYNELVAHGMNSGDDLARLFSNASGSRMSSLGAFVTLGTYEGRHGYSLRLRGTEPEVNDRAEERDLVVHGADYVSDDVARALGRLGRSWGCPAVRPEIAHELIDAIKDGSVVYAWAPAASHAAP